MTAPTETVRIDERGKNQLITLKKRTGLKHWNVLCRWAFCLSLSEASPPPPQEAKEQSNVEMSWSTFAGRNADLFTALLVARCVKDGLATDRETLAEQFRLHLQRGLTYLVGNDETKDLVGLASMAIRRFEATV
jgi:DNA sulfur modification protein DndE